MRENKQENYLLDILVSEGGYQYLMGDDDYYDPTVKSWAMYPNFGIYGDLEEAMFDDPEGTFGMPSPKVEIPWNTPAWKEYVESYFGHRIRRTYFLENIVKNHNLDEIGMKLRNWVIDRIERESEGIEPPEPNLDQAEDDYYNPNFGEPSMFDEPIYGENGERMI